jgi:lipopolysaccharide export system protein LptC
MNRDTTTRPPLASARQRGNWLFEGRRAIKIDLLRRSRFVRVMKVALPLAAVAMVMAVIAWPQMRAQDPGFRISYTSVDMGQVEPSMATARFHGTDRDKRPFRVTADTATQDPSERGKVLLDHLTADLTTKDGTWLSLSALSGIYWETRRQLSLAGDLSMFTERGYEFHGHSAEIDFTAGTLKSDQKVWGQGPFGLLNANGLRILESGDRILFIDGVRTIFYPQAPG